MGKRAGKYGTYVLPRLEEVAAWCRRGLTEREIAKALGVAYSTFRRYKSERDELRDALALSKGLANARVEAAAFEMAAGCFKEIEEAVKVRRVYYDDEGRKCETEDVETRTVNKYFPPRPESNKFWLINRMGEAWGEKSQVVMDVGVHGDDGFVEKIMGVFGASE